MKRAQATPCFLGGASHGLSWQMLSAGEERVDRVELMGYFFTLLYLLTAYITPTVLFGPLAEYHVEVIVVFLAVLFSIPAFSRSGLLRSPQLLAYAGMSFAILISIAQSGWLGGALNAVYGFMQPCFGFFLVAMNCRTRRHLQWIILALVIVSILFLTAGLLDLSNNIAMSPFIYGEGELRRIRGLGFVNDPNDFAQMMVALIPAMWLWRKKSVPANLLLIGVPTLVLLIGMFFTHSRGGSLALMAVIVVSGRRKIGTIPAVVIAACLLAGVFAVGWSGGRDVSMEAGADRLDLWYDGIELIKAHPLFGAGVGGFTEAFGITAHNSVVVCAAEIGMVGLFFWVMLMLSTIRGGVLLGAQGRVKKTEDKENLQRWDELQPRFAANEIKPVWEQSAASDEPISGFAPNELSHDDIREMARILIVSLTGFLTAGWFLSRALSIWLFMFCGLMFAVMRMGAERGLTAKKDGLLFLAGWTACITCALVAAVSLIIRFRNF